MIFWGAGTAEFEASFINKIKSSFLVGSEETQGLKYIGLDLEQSSEFITLDQASYIDKVSQIPLSRSRAAQKHESLDKKEHEELHSLIGQLNWVASHSRPDIAYDVCEISASIKHATKTSFLPIMW